MRSVDARGSGRVLNDQVRCHRAEDHGQIGDPEIGAQGGDQVIELGRVLRLRHRGPVGLAL
ncbi:hypothetical protein R4P47_08130 [Rhodococcus sp. IEGM 1370]|nr:hypothetical protein [Rhodococcus sp. IEGM 1370]MDV8076522.1 hypothetical protein [Rhodococcus sp. IEGM 1370]